MLECSDDSLLELIRLAAKIVCKEVAFEPQPEGFNWIEIWTVWGQELWFEVMPV